MSTEIEKEKTTEKWPTDQGYLYIREDYCKGCGYCIEFCPQEVLEESEGFNEKGYHPPEPTAIDKCVNCGFCSIICPDFAIWDEKEGSNE
ncbi:MAG: ferredoxin family protein [Candidatus Bipolaricaulota bacterium]|nr:ferredoxin family protein [Candidatus Bipolaricaulota bacterium]MBS3792237.1 ferredoxin family protein [Candidatus Bipolaricaulota bacterium]